jgi:RNA polymerase sigma factor (sigma-70 family)
LGGLPADAVAAAVADAHRRDWGYVLAATVRVGRDIDLAEECVQDAYAKALVRWRAEGIPERPAAWLTTVARRKAIDALRRRSTLERKLPLLVDDDVVPAPGDHPTPAGPAGPADPDDERIRLIFTCCHPALSPEARVALTLRLLCGLTTGEVARAFLVSETTMAARLTRAKKKIAAARIPFRVPSASELPARIDAVLEVVHLLFTTGHTAPAGPGLVRHDLVERSLDLARMLRLLLQGNADVAGLLALILITDSRRRTRVGPDGRLLLLQQQDRKRWDRAAIAEGLTLVEEALRPRPPGRFALQAAIAAVHAEAPTWDATDWSRIVRLYEQLSATWPSPVVALNKAVAIGMSQGPIAGLAALDLLAGEPQLRGYSYLPAARADFLRRVGRTAEARAAYEEALALTDNDVERGFLADRLEQLRLS